jgi:hypothetical protein
MRRHHSSARQAIDSSVIGRRGERAFEDLCERARLRIGKPEPDMTGKDYLVEFPFEDPEGIYTLDNRPIPLSCYVQVKTVTYKTERVKIYLKAAEYLIRELKPAFIAIVRLDENENVSGIHMLHVYDYVISSILKRLREEQAKKSFNLSNKSISFPVDVIAPLDCGTQAVKNLISLKVGNNMVDYANRKKAQLDELGYNDYRYQLSMRFRAMPFEDLVDGFLGLRELPTASFEHFDRRFGINLLNKSFSNDVDSQITL